MTPMYLGQIPYQTAVAAQEAGLVIGFEPKPTVSLGIRASANEDLLWPAERWESLGYAIYNSDRGGQATIHNPGQLVIFPVVSVRATGVRCGVDYLREASQTFLRRFGCETRWRTDEPGLYTNAGKILSIGVRVRDGHLHHGLALNVTNDLSVFSGIRTCGHAGAQVDRLNISVPLSELFKLWFEDYKALLTTKANSRNLGAVRSCAPSSVG